jgi:hypothetical protein
VNAKGNARMLKAAAPELRAADSYSFKLLELTQAVDGGHHLLQQKIQEWQTWDRHVAALTSRSTSFLHHNTVRPLLNPGCSTSTPKSLPSSSQAIWGLQQLQLTLSTHPHEQHLGYKSKRWISLQFPCRHLNSLETT